MTPAKLKIGSIVSGSPHWYIGRPVGIVLHNMNYKHAERGGIWWMVYWFETKSKIEAIEEYLMVIIP